MIKNKLRPLRASRTFEMADTFYPLMRLVLLKFGEGDYGTAYQNMKTKWFFWDHHFYDEDARKSAENNYEWLLKQRELNIENLEAASV